MFYLCYFVRGGFYDYSYGNLDVSGSYGRYWESRVYDATFAYYLYFSPSFLNHQHGFVKGYGFSARCVAR